MEMDPLKAKIRTVPDFPKQGILFYDITTLLRDPAGFKEAIDSLVAPHRHQAIDLVAGIESRGFILAAAVADRMGVGFVPMRKPGKLPASTLKETFRLEYGSDSIEIHDDAITSGQRVLIVDDVLATGGTARAAAALVRRSNGELVGLTFLIELLALNGRSQIPEERIHAVLQY